MSEILPGPQPRPLEQQVAIVTGAGRLGGIGAGICEVFAERGVRMVMTDIADSLEEARAFVANRAGIPEQSIRAVKADITLEEDQEKIFAEAARLDDGHIDTLVNNAAIVSFDHIMSGDLDPLPSPDKVRAVLDTNVVAPYAMSRRAARAMRNAQMAGSIIMMGSVHSNPGVVRVQPHYTASKRAIVGMTEELAAILGPYGIRVNAIAPGAINTDPDRTAASLQPPDFKDNMALQRTGTPQEIGKVALFLASPEASYITGSIIPVDGGLIVASSWAARRMSEIRRGERPGAEWFDPRHEWTN